MKLIKNILVVLMLTFVTTPAVAQLTNESPELMFLGGSIEGKQIVLSNIDAACKHNWAGDNSEITLCIQREKWAMENIYIFVRAPHFTSEVEKLAIDCLGRWMNEDVYIWFMVETCIKEEFWDYLLLQPIPNKTQP